MEKVIKFTILFFLVVFLVGSVDFVSSETPNESSLILERLSNIENNLSSQDQRISALESWKTSMESWKLGVDSALSALTTQISDILTTLTGFATRIATLESNHNSSAGNSSNSTEAGTWNNFKKYISSSTRKKMVCEYAEENRLEHIEELGYNCDVTYTTLRSGTERVNCKCDKSNNFLSPTIGVGQV